MTHDDKRTLREGGWLGLLGNLLMMASLPLAPKWPPSSAPTSEVIAYFAQNHDGFLLQAWVANLGVILLIGFAGGLAALARARGAHVIGSLLFGGMLAFASAFALNWTPWIAIAHRPGRSPEVVQALYDFGLLGQFVGVGAALALFFGALAWAVLRERIAPRPFGFIAALAVPLNVALAKATALDGVLSPSGPIGMASLALFGLSLTALSIWMLRAGRA